MMTEPDDNITALEQDSQKEAAPEATSAETTASASNASEQTEPGTDRPEDILCAENLETSDLQEINLQQTGACLEEAPTPEEKEPVADDAGAGQDAADTHELQDDPLPESEEDTAETAGDSAPVTPPQWLEGEAIRLPDSQCDHKTEPAPVVPSSEHERMPVLEIAEAKSINLHCTEEDSPDAACLPAAAGQAATAAPESITTELLFLKVNSADRKDAGKFLKENALMLQVVMAALLLLIFSLGGWQPAVMVFVSAAVVLTLVGLSCLTFYGIKIDPEALVLTRCDWCGRVPYTLAFKDIEKVEESDGMLLFHLQNRRLSWLEKLLFKDIVEKPFYKEPARFKFKIDDFELPEHGKTLLAALEKEGKLINTQPVTLKVNSTIRRSASAFLTHNSSPLRIGLTLCLFALILILPGQLCLWAIVIAMVILCLGVLGGQVFYNITSLPEALLLTRIDWAGETSMSLAWSDIAGVEEVSDGTIRLQLKNPQTSWARKKVFSEVIDGKGQTATLNLNDIENEQERQRLIDLLASNTDFRPKLAVASASPAASETAATAPPTKAGEYAVAYNPHRVAQEKVRNFLGKSEKLWLALLAFACIAMMYSVGMTVALAVLILCCGAGIILVRQNKDNPSELLFDGNGIAFSWASRKSHTIPWDGISHVSAHSPAGRKLFDSMIDIHLKQEIAGKPWLVSLKMLLPFYFASVKGTTIRLRMGGLSGPQARKELLQALRSNLGRDRVGEEVSSLLNPTDPESYTTLWLASLSGAPQRTFEGTLPAGYQLDNGKYEVMELLGAGGQATAYLAAERLPAAADAGTKTVVLKEFILPSHAGAELSTRSIEHIKKEYELIGRIRNEGIVEYHGLFIEDHRAYLVLEHIDGPSLRQLVEKQGAMPQEQVTEFAKQMTDILSHLHGLTPPVVHRDFTPENLILGPNGKLKLIDFNVAQELETNATRTIVGKHSYIPPEQFRGKPCVQSDLYALGATLHFLLTAQEPEPITTSHPAKLNEGVCPALDAIVARATEKELTKRYQSAGELRTELDKLE